MSTQIKYPRSILSALLLHGRRMLAAIENVWSQIWFQPMPTTPIEIIRIGVGTMVFLHYAMATPYLFQFWGNTDWMPLEAAQAMLNMPWSQSVLFYFTEPWHWVAFHGLFVFSIAAFTLGWRTSWVK